MLRCLLIKIGRNQRGLPIRTERTVEGDVLRIGRSAECNIHLQDHRVSLHHAHIRHSSDGKLYIDSESMALQIDGSYVQSAELIVGMQIHLGPYLLVVEALPASNHLTLTYELLQAQQDTSEQIKNWRPSALTSQWLSKRITAWLLFVVIMVGFLLLPILQSISPQLNSFFKHIHLNPHQVWLSGELSNAHRGSNTSCMDCHRTPFKTVSNSTCTKCHAETTGHGKHAQKNKAGTPNMDCTQCHREHQGGGSMPNRSEAECVNCHANIKRYDSQSALADVHDFAEDHADFKLSIKTGKNEADVRRVLQPADATKASGNQPKEDSGLKFPHDQHVGLVQGPGGMSDIRDLKCTNCHQADEAGQRYRPVNFKSNCVECHSDQMELNPKVNNRLLPHTSTAELSSTLKDYYTQLAFNNKQSAGWINEQLEKASKSLSEADGCAYCHVTKPSTDPQKLFEVVPLQLTRHWFPAANFTHKQHATSKCADCHQVEKSTDSADIAIPNKQSCLQCHAGFKAYSNKVTSTCISCHNFHSPAKMESKRKN